MQKSMLPDTIIELPDIQNHGALRTCFLWGKDTKAGLVCQGDFIEEILLKDPGIRIDL
jgi:hypothetical protein